MLLLMMIMIMMMIMMKSTVTTVMITPSSSAGGALLANSYLIQYLLCLRSDPQMANVSNAQTDARAPIPGGVSPYPNASPSLRARLHLAWRNLEGAWKRERWFWGGYLMYDVCVTEKRTH